MRFRHNKVNFKVTYYQKSSVCYLSTFVPVLISFICDLEFDLIMLEPYCVNFIFANLVHS